MIIPRPVHIDTLEDATLTLVKLEGEAKDDLQTIRERQKNLIRVRFRQGQIVAIVSREAKWGDGAIQKLSQGTGIHLNTLYECRRFFLLPEFHESPAMLEQWMTAKEEEKGQIHWTYCRALVHKALDENDPEEAATKLEKQKAELERKAEKLEQEAEDLRQRAGTMPVSQEHLDEVDGIATQAEIVAQDTREQLNSLPKPERVTDSAYLQHVRSSPCVICGNRQTDAHHIIPGGMATKTSDYHTVPLCRTHHSELHANGSSSFWQQYGRDPWKLVAQMLISWITSQSSMRGASS